MQNGPSYSSSTAMKPEKSASPQSRCSVSACCAAFFPPGLDPVLDRGERDEHAVVAPQGPLGGAVGQTVLHHEADGGGDDPAGVVAAGVGQVGHVGVEIAAALRAVVLGVEHHEVAGPAGEGVAEVVEGAAGGPVTVGAVATPGAGSAAVVAAPEADVRPGQVVDAGDALGGIGAVFAGSWHGVAPGRRGLPGGTPGGGKLFAGWPGFLATESENPPCAVQRDRRGGSH